MTNTEICPDCEGEGQTSMPWPRICIGCNGTGEIVPSEMTIDDLIDQQGKRKIKVNVTADCKTGYLMAICKTAALNAGWTKAQFDCFQKYAKRSNWHKMIKAVDEFFICEWPSNIWRD